MTETMTQEELVQAVQATAQDWKRENPETEIEFTFKFARHEADWYYVLVSARNRPKRTYQYYDYLHEIEQLILIRHEIKVLLVPALANAV